MSPDVLHGDGVALRPLRVDDVEDVTAGCSDPMTLRYLPHLPSPYTRDDALWWITEGAPARIAAGGWAFAIADPKTDRLLGGCGLQPRGEATAEIGYWVAPWGRRRSAATAAARAMTEEAFRTGLGRVYLRNEPENSPSQRVALNCGFSREGTQRGGGANRDGSRHDLLVWARLSDDPAGPTHRVLPDLPGGELTDGVITIRPIQTTDVEDTLALRSLADVAATSVPPRTPDRAFVERFCARSEAGWLAGERADLTIRDAATGAYAGEIGLYYFEPPTQQAMIGYSMAPAWRGRGFATRASRLVAQWAFSIGIVRVVAGTDTTNIGSQRVLESAGFVREAYERDRLPTADGGRADNYLYVKLADGRAAD